MGTESGKHAVKIGEMGSDGLLQGGLADEDGLAPGVDHPDEIVDGGPCSVTGGSAEAGGAQADLPFCSPTSPDLSQVSMSEP